MYFYIEIISWLKKPHSYPFVLIWHWKQLPRWLSGKEICLPMQVQTLGREDPLEEEMATHSNILSWETHGQRNTENTLLWPLDWLPEFILDWNMFPINHLTIRKLEQIKVWNVQRFPGTHCSLDISFITSWCGIPICLRIFHSLLWSTQSKAFA